MIKKLLVFLLFFIEVISPNLVFLPIRTRWIFAAIGAFFIIGDAKYGIFEKKEKKLIRHLILWIGIIFIIALMSSVINGVFDSYFYRIPISIGLSFLSAYGFFYISNKLLHKRYAYEEVLEYIVAVMFVQCVISLICFLIPGVGDILYSLFEYSEMAQQANEVTAYYGARIIGFSIAYFSAGTYYAISMCFIVYLLIIDKRPIKDIVLFTLLFIVILGIGTSIARTTLFGLIGVLLFVLAGTKNISKRLIRFIPVLLVFIPLVIYIFNNYLLTDDVLGPTLERSFAIFQLLSETGSAGELDSYVGEQVLPESLKTWIIGDGLMADPLHPELSNYMEVDRGYIRTIFCIGVIGLIAYCMVQLYLCKLTRLGKRYEWILFFLYCGFMIKGIYSMDVFLSPIFTYVIFEQIQSKKQYIYESTKRSLSRV